MSSRDSPGQRALARVLAMVYVVVLPAAITAMWIRGTVLSTGGYVAAVAPLSANPVVRAAVRSTIDGEVSLVTGYAIKSAAPAPSWPARDSNGCGLPPTPRRTARSSAC